jgi:hypothetical protein
MEVVMGIVTVITTVKTLYNTSKDVRRYVEKKNNKLNTTSMEPWLLVEEDEDLVIVEVSS